MIFTCFYLQKQADFLLKKKKLIFFEKLEIIKELECLEANLFKVTIGLLLIISEVILVSELDFFLEYLLKYLEDFPSDLSFF